jgi:hypothetical protein
MFMIFSLFGVPGLLITEYVKPAGLSSLFRKKILALFAPHVGLESSKRAYGERPLFACEPAALIAFVCHYLSSRSVQFPEAHAGSRLQPIIAHRVRQGVTSLHRVRLGVQVRTGETGETGCQQGYSGRYAGQGGAGGGHFGSTILML